MKTILFLALATACFASALQKENKLLRESNRALQKALAEISVSSSDGHKCGALKSGSNGNWVTEDSTVEFLGEASSDDECRELCDQQDTEGVCLFKVDYKGCHFSAHGTLQDYYDRYGWSDVKHKASICSTSTDVSCGGHRAETCSGCPGNSGASSCHGDCTWLDNACVLASDAAAIAKEKGLPPPYAWIAPAHVPGSGGLASNSHLITCETDSDCSVNHFCMVRENEHNVCVEGETEPKTISEQCIENSATENSYDKCMCDRYGCIFCLVEVLDQPAAGFHTDDLSCFYCDTSRKRNYKVISDCGQFRG